MFAIIGMLLETLRALWVCFFKWLVKIAAMRARLDRRVLCDDGRHSRIIRPHHGRHHESFLIR